MDPMEGIVYGESGEATASSHERENQETTAMSRKRQRLKLEKVKLEARGRLPHQWWLRLKRSSAMLKKVKQETAEPKPWWCMLKPKTAVSLLRERLRKRCAKMLQKLKQEKLKLERWKEPMLTGDIAEDLITFLSSRNIKFLDSGTGQKVPISDLKGKTIGLYFYGTWIPTRVFVELAHMYKKRREMGRQDFEIVFVCMHYQRWSVRPQLFRSYEESVEKKFYKYFMGNTWLALPFEYRKSIRLLCDWGEGFGESKSGFVIIQPGQNIVHTRPMEIYKDYGIQAYPFSKSKVTEIEVARLKSLTLDQVLFSRAAAADEKFVYDKDGQKISASFLEGKNILLFFTSPHGFCLRNELLYEKVIQLYVDRKCCDESLEMLNVLYKDKCKHVYKGDQIAKEASNSPCKKISCLEYPYDKDDDLEALYSKLLVRTCAKYNGRYKYIPMFVAFGLDGRFITMRIFADSSGLAYKDVDYDRLDLFSADDLYAQVSDYIAVVKSWCW